MKEDTEQQKLLEKSNLKRIDHTYISREITHVLHLDRGFFFTVKELFLGPGKTVRNFLFNDRDSLVKPFLFLIICAIIFSLTNHFLHLEIVIYNIDGDAYKGKVNPTEIGEWTNHYIGYAQLIMAIFISLWIKLFFRKFPYNIYEILVLLSFVLGEALLILILVFIPYKIFHFEAILKIGIGFYFFYIIWAIGQFFGEKKMTNYLKSTLSYACGVFTFMASLKLIAYLLSFI
jgi:hypothetical protein